MTRQPASVWRRVTVSATSVVLTVLLALVPFVGPSDATSTSANTSTVTVSTPALTAATTATRSVSTVVEDALAEADGNAAVTVVDLATGDTETYGDAEHGFDTASIVKVDILVALLLQAQDEGRELTTAEEALAARMIENSDNEAATELFDAVGGKSGLETVNDRLGLTDTEVGADGYWGLTQTTSADQVRLLAQVFTDESELDADARTYIQGLMGDVIASQRFGVSAAADDPAAAELKVGWLQRSATGLWVVNSIGSVERGGRTYLVAVLSDGNTDYDDGVALVDSVAKAAVTGSI